ncbi:hypothetical protein [Rahnella sp. EDr1-12]|uniref:hypothetical protein n=1 Tax=unclassified Rahnella TaxID=2635087 RepID=UPI003BA8C5ED
MKRELSILIYVIAMGSFIIFVVAFLSRLFTYWSNDIAIPFEELLYISFKVGLAGGTIGGVGTWLMHIFNLYRHR